MDKKHSIGELSESTALAISVLKETPIGGIVTYERLRIAMRRNPQREGRGNVCVARNIVRRDEKMVFDVIPNVGYKRLDDAGVVKKLGSRLSRVRRMSSNGLKDGDTIDLPRLSNEERMFAVTRQTQLALTHKLATTKATAKLQQLAARSERLQLREALDAVRDTIKEKNGD